MLDASEKFISALAYSHQSLTKVLIDGTQMPIVSGSITLDQSRGVLCTGNMRIANEYGIADAITTASRVDIYKGIKFLDRTEEYVLIAQCIVQDATRDDVNNAWRDLVLADHGQFVEDLPLLAPFSPSGMTYVQAIQALITAAVPYTPDWWVDGSVSSASPPADAIVQFNTGRWSAIQQFSQAIGVVVQNVPVDGFPNGVWAIYNVPTDGDPVHDFYTGAGGVVTGATRTASRREIFNGIAAEWGTSDTEGGIVIVTDDDPSSPTYWDGPWGKKARTLTGAALPTSDAAIAAATVELSKSKGAQSGINFSSVYMPLVQTGDIIGVRLPNTVREKHIIDTITLPLVGGVMTATTRVVGVA